MSWPFLWCVVQGDRWWWEFLQATIFKIESYKWVAEIMRFRYIGWNGHLRLHLRLAD